MKNVFTTPTAANLGLFLGRLPIGTLFLGAGIMKIHGGVSAFVNQSAASVPSFMPDYLGKTYLTLLPFVEVLIGALLILGLFTRSAAAIASLVLISIMIAVTGVLAGKGMYMPHFNAVYLGLTLLLMLNGGGTWTIDRLYKAGARSSSK
jgi:uncharacterized membrane protein YphA (DoxX/SURF4 family)